MKKIISSLFIVMSLASSTFAIDANDSAEINAAIEHFTNAWNLQGGRGIADHYSADADFVNPLGMVTSGKEQIEARHIKILETFMKGSIFEVVNVRLREAQPGVVIALVYWNVTSIQSEGRNYFTEATNGVFTHVFLKNAEGNWEITASQNTISRFK